MLNNITPEQAQMMQKESEAPEQENENENEQGSRGASEILVGLNSGFNQLGDLIEQSQLPPEDKVKFNKLYQQFVNFTEGLSAPKDAAQTQRPVGTPMMAMGNPNAKPMM